jgi:hypothetical protein
MSLRSFSEFFKCSRVKSIQEINDDYDYADEHPQRTKRGQIYLSVIFR